MQTNVNEFFTNESIFQTNSRINVSYNTDYWEKVSIRLTGKILNLILTTKLYCICNFRYVTFYFIEYFQNIIIYYTYIMLYIYI